MNIGNIFEKMQTAHNANTHLLHLGRLFSQTVLIEVDQLEIYLHFEGGRLAPIQFGPSRKTPWRFAFRTNAGALHRFWQPIPDPGFHDIFGLVKSGQGRIDGDILELVKNLRFFKEFMALPREGKWT